MIIGTMDGANIEISQEIGHENIFTFGKKTEEINDARERMRSMNYEDYFCTELKELISDVRGGLLGDPHIFEDLLNSFTNNNDYYLVGTDFMEYKKSQELVDETYKQTSKWAKMSILGAIRMKKFSTDRTITDYATKIWGIEHIEIQNNQIVKGE